MSAADLAFTTANAAAGSAAPPPPPPAGPPESAQHPLANYKFSTDELRVLRECNVESFWQRSLPLGTAFGVAAYMAVRNGYLKGNTRYGAGPKAAVGVIVGYFLGKFSYQQRCAEKIMQLPNSKLAEMLKMRKCGGIAETFSADQGFGAALSMSPFGSATDQYSDVASKKSSSLNLDTERPSNQGLDDAFRPNVDNSTTTTYEDNLPLDPPRNPTSYDELRQRNRDDYQQKQSNPYYRNHPAHISVSHPDSPLAANVDQMPPPVVRAPPPPAASDTESRQAKNKYGDLV